VHHGLSISTSLHSNPPQHVNTNHNSRQPSRLTHPHTQRLRRITKLLLALGCRPAKCPRPCAHPAAGPHATTHTMVTR
jgi:hypothetical protein